uniref:RRM domain-containing protein n=1 Tax=Populus davidiana TaxID=266767 RepID=A0A6M2FA06_9ROSI
MRTRHYSLLLSKLKPKQQLHQRQPQYHYLRQSNFSTPKLCCCLFRSNSLHLPSRKGLTVLAVEDKEPEIAEEINNVSQENGDFESEKQTKPCELYVCNLPRCSDIADLVEMFKSFGSVLSVELHYIIWKLGGILAKNWKDEILSSMVDRLFAEIKKIETKLT